MVWCFTDGYIINETFHGLLKTVRNFSSRVERYFIRHFSRKEPKTIIFISGSKVSRLRNRRWPTNPGEWVSVDDGARKSNKWLDQWYSGKLGTGSRVKSVPLAFPSSNDVPVPLLNQPNRRRKRTAKHLCVTNVTGLLLECFVVIFT